MYLHTPFNSKFTIWQSSHTKVTEFKNNEKITLVTQNYKVDFRMLLWRDAEDDGQNKKMVRVTKSVFSSWARKTIERGL